MTHTIRILVDVDKRGELRNATARCDDESACWAERTSGTDGAQLVAGVEGDDHAWQLQLAGPTPQARNARALGALCQYVLACELERLQGSTR